MIPYTDDMVYLELCLTQNKEKETQLPIPGVMSCTTSLCISKEMFQRKIKLKT